MKNFISSKWVATEKGEKTRELGPAFSEKMPEKELVLLRYNGDLYEASYTFYARYLRGEFLRTIKAPKVGANSGVGHPSI